MKLKTIQFALLPWAVLTALVGMSMADSTDEPPVDPMPLLPVDAVSPPSEATAPVSPPAPEQPADPTPEPEPAITPESIETPAAEATPPEPPHVEELTERELILLDSLRQKNLRLQEQLQEQKQRNEPLAQTLRDTRERASELQEQLTRNTIQVQLLQNEVQRLQHRLGELPEEAANSSAPLDTAMEIRRLRLENERLDLLLKLARLGEPERSRELTEELATALTRIEELEKKNDTLGKLIASQNERIREQKLRIARLDRLEKRPAPPRRETGRTSPPVEAYAIRHDEQDATASKEIDPGSSIATIEPVDVVEAKNSPAEPAAPAEPTSERAPEPSPPLASAVTVGQNASTAPPAANDSEQEAEEVSAVTESQPISDARLEPERTAVARSDDAPRAEPLAASPATQTEEGPAATPFRRVISGSVNDVRDSTILLNIGRQQGVEKNLRMIVYRDDKFVGYLRIQHVEEDSSAGIMTTTVLPPADGDSVIDRLQ